MEYKLSIIVPIYNAENNLEQLIKSIINQTMDFNDIELVLVDDKSTDNSKSIIEDYSNQYDNIKPIFLEKNSGWASIPRNIALKSVTSDYLIFIDSDDLILSDYCETLYDAIVEEDADIVFCMESFKFMEGIYSRCENSKEREVFKDPLLFRGTVWGNIFKREIFEKNNLEFPKYCEDVIVALIAYTKSNKIIKLPSYNGYIYTVESEGEQSLTHSVTKENISNTIEGYTFINNYLDENNLKKDDLISKNVHTLYLVFIKFKGSKSERIALLKEIINFQKLADCNIKIPSKPFDILNRLVLKGHFSMALFLCSIASWIYDNRKIKNLIFRRSFNMDVQIE